MKRLLLTFVLLLTSTTTLLAQDDWAQYGRYAEANAAITTQPDAVFMGNSITDCWASQRPEFFEKNNFVGRGISGQTSSHMVCRFRADVINLNPKAVVILAGINDIAENNGPIELEHVAENIISMCELALANDINVVLCTTLPCDSLKWRLNIKPAEKVKELNTKVYEWAKGRKGITYCDYYSVMANEKGGMDPELSYDGCHTTAYGYSIMEGIVTKAIQKAIKRKQPYFTPAQE